jgi:two-component system chemotaxis family response regulator WspR
MVLLVDDQVMVAEAVRRALSGERSIDFHYCADPHEALAVAKHLGPTVILQDLVMPGFSGLDLVRTYRADPVTEAIPIIVLSVKEEPTVKSDAFKAGANDYLVKLPDKIELIARIRYHSMAYMNQLQRDEAYRALRESQKQLMEANLELQRLNNVDGLTGLSNRRYFDEFMAAEWKRSSRSGTALALLMIDVDNFKQYNDTYGHLAGDEVLKTVADAVRKASERSTDIAARFGGEEFVIILPSTDLAGALHLGEKVRRDIEGLALPHRGSTTGGYITVSIGAASALPQRDDGHMRVIDDADQALYDAKRGGRNCVVAKPAKTAN